MATQARRGTAGRTIGTFALGAALGSIVALLYAPASGTVTRKRLKMKLKAVGKSAVELKTVAARKIGDARQWMRGHFTPTNGRRHQPVH